MKDLTLFPVPLFPDLNTPPRASGLAIQLARKSIGCNRCFEQLPLSHAGISLPQPFAVARNYRRGGVAIIGINPGASTDGGYKEKRKHALDCFASGKDAALEEYWDALATDAEQSWNPRYLARLRSLKLDLDSLFTGNIALCATAENRYPKKLLRNCWELHTASVLKAYAPGVVVFMGSEGVIGEFVRSSQNLLPESSIVRMAHYAHRKGKAYEAQECARVMQVIRCALQHAT